MSSSSAELIARVSNLTPAVTANHLRELLSSEVKIREVRMPESVLWMSCPTGRAEVIGESEDDTKNVFVRLHGAQLDGALLTVNLVRIDPSLPPVVVVPSQRTGDRRPATDSHRDRRRSRSPPSRDRHHRDRDRYGGDRHRDHQHRSRHHHSRDRSRSPSEYSRASSRSPAPGPAKQRRTATANPVALPAPVVGILQRPPSPQPGSRSRSPVWQ